MTYFSPFDFLPFSEAPPDPRAFIQAQRRLFAEFELQGNPVTIKIGGQEFDKASALKLIESLKDEKAFRFHRIIFEDQSLLAFLAKGELNPRIANDNARLTELQHSDEAFVDFISPYFAPVYANLFCRILEKAKPGEMQKLADFPVLVSSENQPGFMRQIEGAVEKLAQVINPAQFFFPVGGELHPELESRIVPLIYHFPAEFKPARKRLVNQVLSLANAQITTSSYRQQLIRIFGKMKALETEEDLKLKLSRAILKFQEEETGKTSAAARESRKTGGEVLVYIVIALLAMVFLVKKGGGLHHTDEDYKLPDFVYKPIEIPKNNHMNIEENFRQQKIKMPELIARSLFDFYSKNPNVPDTGIAGIKQRSSIANGTEPYSEALSPIDIFNPYGKGDSFAKIRITNKSGEDILLIGQNKSDLAAASLYIAAGKSASTEKLDAAGGILVYLCGGKGWAPYFSIPAKTESGTNGTPVFPSRITGIFCQPDRDNLHNLYTPVIVQSEKDSAAAVKNGYRMTIAKDENGFFTVSCN